MLVGTKKIKPGEVDGFAQPPSTDDAEETEGVAEARGHMTGGEECDPANSTCLIPQSAL